MRNLFVPPVRRGVYLEEWGCLDAPDKIPCGSCVADPREPMGGSPTALQRTTQRGEDAFHVFVIGGFEYRVPVQWTYIHNGLQGMGYVLDDA